MATTAHDPIRADVERILHAVVDLTIVLPLRVATAVPRCVLRRAARGPLAEPVRIVRSIVDLVGSSTGARGVVAPDDAPVPAEPAVAVVEPSARRDDDAALDLPIEDYESLAASHVVDRLATLTPVELREVRDFETAHRGRRTVLGRIEQLLG